MIDEVQAGAREDGLDGAVAAFRETAFLLGPFPTFSQTFIHREFEEMVRLGLDVNIVSTCPRRPERKAASESLLAIQKSAVHLQYRSPLVLASALSPVVPREVRRAIRWMEGFPHRTRFRRFRAGIAVRAAARLAPELKRRGIRYVHSHFAGFQTEVAMGLSRLLDIPYGCTWHATGIYQDRNILKEKVAGARVVLTCTRYNVEHLRRLCPAHADRIQLAYHGLDLAGTPEAAPIEAAERPVVLAVGRFVAKKGFQHLVRAAALLKEWGVAYELQFIGTGSDGPRLGALVERLGLGDVVSFLGALPLTDVYRRMAQARVLAAPSVVTAKGDLDGLPNVILEAMSMGRPVVGSRISAIPEVVMPGETGLLSEPGKVEELAAHLRTLLEDPRLARTLGEKGRKLVRERFDVRQNVRHVIRHIANPTSATDGATLPRGLGRGPNACRSGQSPARISEVRWRWRFE